MFSETDARVSLNYQDKVADLSCKIELKPNGVVTWQSSPVVLSNDTWWLMPLMVPDTEVMTLVSFRAEVKDAGVITSESSYLTHHKNSGAAGKPDTISVGGELARATLKYAPFPKESTGLIVRYFAIGMTGFNPVSVDSPIGKVTQTGNPTIENYNNLCGAIVIEAPATAMPFDNWLAECDRMASRVFDMYSFAQGRFIRWSIRQVQEGERVMEVEFLGAHSTGIPMWPVFPSEFGMVLDMAVNRYTQELCDQNSVPTAVEWFVHHPYYTELQLTSAVTALEHLISVEDYGKYGPRILTKERFVLIRAEFEKILAAIKPESEEEAARMAIMKKKVSELNMGSLMDKVLRYLVHHKVPMYGLTDEEVLAAVGARNDVVHRGQYDAKDTDVRLYRHVSFLRELVTRVFLTLLKYEGPYSSYLGGFKRAVFPPRPPQEAVAAAPPAAG